MARIPLNTVVTISSSYTVPAGKVAVMAAYVQVQGTGAKLQVNGGTSGEYPVSALTIGTRIAPLTAAAGDVLSIAGGSGILNISGFLYDA